MTLDDRLLKPASWQYDDYQTAKQAILSDLLEIIGEDEHREVGYELQKTINRRSQLRQELRTKLKEYFGESTLHARLKNGMEPKMAVFKPVRGRRVVTS